ncbi:aldo/keto reductase [Streptomyces phytophilus]|uniref:aldo/keto reductase n=1 Tax=Streptomyces phytophilus TaxID=722715 RepID=UPI0015F0CE17|nr:aldo/keto reductase [Streptomyces phytophilus]
MTTDDSPTTATRGTTRRRVLQATGGLAVAAAAAGAGTAAAQGRAGAPGPRELITREVPGTGERLPAVGLGTFTTFDTLPDAPTGHIAEVVRRFYEAGGRVVDTSPLYGAAETNTGAALTGFQDRVFLADKIWSTGDFLWDEGHALASLERSMERLARGRPLDVVQVHSLVNIDCVLPMLHAWKREGRIRAIGVTHHEPAYFDVLADWIERGDVDFVQVHYSVRTRAAEERVLPAAADNGVAVLVNMPLEKARLHHVVRGREVPDLVGEFGAATWSQFFLKWVLSHPAVTAVLPATSDPDHLTENVGAMRGELPDRALRRLMVRYMEKVPGFDALPTAPWYPGKSYPGLVTRAQSAIRERSPWWPPVPTA